MTKRVEVFTSPQMRYADCNARRDVKLSSHFHKWLLVVDVLLTSSQSVATPLGRTMSARSMLVLHHPAITIGWFLELQGI